MSRFVHGLGRGVEFSFVIRGGVGQGGCGHQGALLAMQELRELMGRGMGDEGFTLGFGEICEEGNLIDTVAGLADDGLRGIDLDGPVEILLSVPLQALGLAVEVLEFFPADLVVELPTDLHGVLQNFGGFPIGGHGSASSFFLAQSGG